MKKQAIDFLKIPKYDGCAIYAIVNWEDFSCYVGSTRNANKRVYQHKNALIKGQHANKRLQEDADNQKILRFVMLHKLPQQIDNETLLLLEYFYMLQMRWKCFKLYNQIPKKGCYMNETEALKIHILCKIDSIIKAAEKIEKAMFKTYGIKTGYMLNTKYREYEAKRQITDN